MSRDYSNGVASGREDSRWMRNRIQHLEGALTAILGWREFDLPEGDRAQRAIECMEALARAGLDAQEKGDG